MYALFVCCIGNFISYTAKNPPGDAHSRELKYVAYATALGASVSQARHYFTV